MRRTSPDIETEEQGSLTQCDCLRGLLIEHGIAFSQKKYETSGADDAWITIETANLQQTATADTSPIDSVIQDMLKKHAIKGEGTVGGAVETYRLVGGAVFSVVWIGQQRDAEHALLNIAHPKAAY